MLHSICTSMALFSPPPHTQTVGWSSKILTDASTNFRRVVELPGSIDLLLYIPILTVPQIVHIIYEEPLNSFHHTSIHILVEDNIFPKFWSTKWNIFQQASITWFSFYAPRRGPCEWDIGVIGYHIIPISYSKA